MNTPYVPQNRNVSRQTQRPSAPGVTASPSVRYDPPASPRIFENRLYTLEEASVVSGVKLITLRRWVSERKLEARRPKGTTKYFVHGDVLEDFFAIIPARSSSSPKASEARPNNGAR